MSTCTNPFGIPDEELMLQQRALLYPEESVELRKPLPAGDFMTQAYQLALLGLGDQELADVFAQGDLEALRQWMSLYPALTNIITKGRLFADAQVAHSLFRRANGYELEDVRERYAVKEDGSLKRVGYERRTQHVPASVDAIELWLKTRQPRAWPLKPLQPEDALPGEPEATEDDVTDIIRRLERLRDRKQQGPGGGEPDPEGPVD